MQCCHPTECISDTSIEIYGVIHHIFYATQYEMRECKKCHENVPIEAIYASTRFGPKNINNSVICPETCLHESFSVNNSMQVFCGESKESTWLASYFANGGLFDDLFSQLGKGTCTRCKKEFDVHLDPMFNQFGYNPNAENIENWRIS